MQQRISEPTRQELVENFFAHVVRQDRYQKLDDFIKTLNIKEKESLLVGKPIHKPQASPLDMESCSYLRRRLKDMKYLIICSLHLPKVCEILILMLGSSITAKNLRTLDPISQMKKLDELKEGYQDEKKYILGVLSEDISYDQSNTSISESSSQVTDTTSKEISVADIQREEPTKGLIDLAGGNSTRDKLPFVQSYEEEEKKEVPKKIAPAKDYSCRISFDKSNVYEDFEDYFAGPKPALNESYQVPMKSENQRKEQSQDGAPFMTDEDLCMKVLEEMGLLPNDKKAQQAYENYTKALEVEPTFQLYAARASLLISMKKSEEAVSDLDKAIALTPPRSVSRYGLMCGKAEHLASNGNLKGAEDVVEEILRLNPQCLEACKLKCKILSTHKEFSLLLEYTTMVINKYFDKDAALIFYQSKVWALKELGRSKEALEVADEFIKLNKESKSASNLSNMTINLYKALIFLDQSRVTEAQDCYINILRDEPKDNQDMKIKLSVAGLHPELATKSNDTVSFVRDSSNLSYIKEFLNLKE